MIGMSFFDLLGSKGVDRGGKRIYQAQAMRLFYLSFLLMIAGALVADESLLWRIHAHLLIKESEEALRLSQAGLEKEPGSVELQEALVEAYAQLGEDREALQALKQLHAQAEEPRDHLLERVAWTIIKKGEREGGTVTRLAAALGAGLTRDAQALELVMRYLQSSRALFRAIGLELAPLLRDSSLREAVSRSIHQETRTPLRLIAIQSAVKMGMKEILPYLQELLANQRTPVEVQAAAGAALAELVEDVEQVSLERLAGHPRVHCRLLATQLIGQLDLDEHLPLLLQLTDDPQPDVRIGAFVALGLLSKKEEHLSKLLPQMHKWMEDPLDEVSITVAWALTCCGQIEGRNALLNWLESPKAKSRRMAAAALAASGAHGASLALAHLKTGCEDPYVRANLAIGLIGQRCETARAGEILYQTLEQQEEKLMVDEESHPLFHPLVPSEVRHQPHIVNKPEAVNQKTRLELLGLLVTSDHPLAEEAIKHFLGVRQWGITGMAALTLLEEGQPELIDLIRKLLNDEDEKVRIDAALGLAIWGRDQEALQTLQQAYPSADRLLKIKILEGVAHVGSRESLPFLLECLGDPFQTLRIIAASAIVQCING